ncbi:MAG: class C sortase [Ileibacterium sp.]|nr:class C sortase [Ileibacterium sp.]
MKKKKKIDISTVLLLGIFLIGFGLIIYPPFANWWNQDHAAKVISSYDESISRMNQEKINQELEKAQKFNEQLWTYFFPLKDEEALKDYNDILNINGDGVIGSITIDKINVNLPIYHGTSAEVLNTAVGHLEGTSFPTGDIDTHCVLSAHRGLPSALLFTNLDALREGDVFVLNVLNKKQYYEVDQIRIVKPSQVEELYLQKGKTYVTLLTCTPYGINSERLLVRGHLVDAPPGELVSEAVELDSLILSPLLFVLLVVLLLVALWKYDKNKKIHREKITEDLIGTEDDSK